MLQHLPRVIPSPPDRPEVGGPDHPMRKVTRQVAFEPGGWTPERAAKVGALFDGLAPEWHTRFTEDRADPLLDALDRGEIRGARCVEIGGGIGFSTTLLAERFPRLAVFDLSLEMLRRAPAAAAQRVQADAACLPITGGVADVIVLENMLLFPAEVDRVLAPGGAVVWVNSLGECTPIHLSADDLLAALPGDWAGVTSEAGWGTWCVARRASTPSQEQ